jgi:Kdo2-lipid IVA lauroyltransferase/acyltransferase
LRLFFRFLAWLGLPANHAVGVLLGRIFFIVTPGWRRRTRENLAASGLVHGDGEVRRLVRENVKEIGKGASELAWALFRRPEEVCALVRSLDGWEEVERLRAGSRPILFVIPHLGGYDIAGRFLWTRLPILAMYRPQKLAWLDALMREGRNRGAAPDGSNIAPANMAGVRMLLRHLRGGGCSVILPDQVPGDGDGEWVEFFGRPAYTMTLPARLQQATGAAIVFCYAERLPRSEGFRMHFRALDAPLPEDRARAARLLNAEIERMVRACPAQFLWGYNRYRRPSRGPASPAVRAR